MSLNGWLYVNGNPANLTDPTGQFADYREICEDWGQCYAMGTGRKVSTGDGGSSGSGRNRGRGGDEENESPRTPIVDNPPGIYPPSYPILTSKPMTNETPTSTPSATPVTPVYIPSATPTPPFYYPSATSPASTPTPIPTSPTVHPTADLDKLYQTEYEAINEGFWHLMDVGSFDTLLDFLTIDPRDPGDFQANPFDNPLDKLYPLMLDLRYWIGRGVATVLDFWHDMNTKLENYSPVKNPTPTPTIYPLSPFFIPTVTPSNTPTITPTPTYTPIFPPIEIPGWCP